MTKPFTNFALSLGIFALTGCNPENRLASNTDQGGGLWSLMPTSPVFRAGRPIPKKYAADGENISPPLLWGAGPTGTKEFVLIVEDADTGDKQPPVCWMVYHIPGSSRGLAEGAATDDRLTQGKNHKGTTGYAGPQPESKPHRYYFELFAVNASLDLPPGADRAAVLYAMHVIELSKGELIGTFGK